jgi:hypothetical protein
MGAYCTLLDIRRHPASLGEIMEVRCPSPYYDGVLFGDRKEIACIPHKGCLLEIVAVGDTTHREANRLLPGKSSATRPRSSLATGLSCQVARRYACRSSSASSCSSSLPEPLRSPRRRRSSSGQRVGSMRGSRWTWTLTRRRSGDPLRRLLEDHKYVEQLAVVGHADDRQVRSCGGSSWRCFGVGARRKEIRQ